MEELPVARILLLSEEQQEKGYDASLVLFTFSIITGKSIYRGLKDSNRPKLLQ